MAVPLTVTMMIVQVTQILSPYKPCHNHTSLAIIIQALSQPYKPCPTTHTCSATITSTKRTRGPAKQRATSPCPREFLPWLRTTLGRWLWDPRDGWWWAQPAHQPMYIYIYIYIYICMHVLIWHVSMVRMYVYLFVLYVCTCACGMHYGNCLCVHVYGMYDTVLYTCMCLSACMCCVRIHVRMHVYSYTPVHNPCSILPSKTQKLRLFSNPCILSGRTDAPFWQAASGNTYSGAKARAHHILMRVW
jgi:hypothetical protein